uniref:Zinc finger protein 710 n=1 Tax=Cacopsylla melanoneura TaxID=428564 RepID=A0A8D8ZMY0_9HEMI
MSLEKLEIYNAKQEAVSCDDEPIDSPTNILGDSKYVTSEDSLETRNQSISQSKASPSQRRNDILSRSAKNVRSSPKNIHSSSRSVPVSPNTENGSPKNLHFSPRRSQEMSPRQSTPSSWHSSPTSTLSTRNSTRNNSPNTSSTNSTPNTRLHSPSTRQSTSSIATQQNTEENKQGDSDSDIRIEKDKIVIKINLKNINQKTASKKKKKKRKKCKKSKEKSSKKSKIYSNVSVNIESNLKYSASSEEPLKEQGRSDTVAAVESSSHTLGPHEQPVFSTNPFAIRKNDGAIRINSGVVVNNTHGKYSLRNSGNMNTRLSQKILQLTQETLHMNYNNSLLTNNNNLIAKQLSCTSVTQMKDSIHKAYSSPRGFQNGMISNLAMLQQRRARLYKCKSVREMLLQSASMDDLQYTCNNPVTYNNHTNSNDLDYLDRFNNNSKDGCDMNNIDSLGSLERLAEDCIDLTEEDAELDNEFIDFHALETLIPYETYLQNVRNGENGTASFEGLKNTENEATSHADHNTNSVKSKTSKVRSDPIGNIPKTPKKLAATTTSKTAKMLKKRTNMAETRDVMSTGTSSRTMTNVKVPNTIRIDKTYCEIREIRPPPFSDDVSEPNSDSQISESTHYPSHEQTQNQPNEPFSTNAHTAQHHLQNAPSKPFGPIKTMYKPTQSHLSSTNHEQYQALPTNANRTKGKHEEHSQPSSNKLSISPVLRSQTNQSQTKEINSNVKDSMFSIDVKKHAKNSTEISADLTETSVVRPSTSTDGLVLRSNKTRDVSKESPNVPKDNVTIIAQSKFKDGTPAKWVIPLKQSLEKNSNKSQTESVERSIGEGKPHDSPKDGETLNGQNNSNVSQEICDLSKETSDESKTTSPTIITDRGVHINAIHSNPNTIPETSQDTKSNAKEDIMSESSNLVEKVGDNLQKVAEDGLDGLEQNGIHESSSQETLFEALNLFKDRNHLPHSKQKKQNEINNLLLELDRLDSNENGSNGNKIKAVMPTLDSTIINSTDKKNFDQSSGIGPLSSGAEENVEQLSVVHVNTTVPNPLERAIDLIAKLDVTSTSMLDATSCHEEICTVQETRKSERIKKLQKEPDMSNMNVKTSDILPDTEKSESEDRIDSSVQKKVQLNITEDIASSSSISKDILETSKEYVEESGDKTKMYEAIPEIFTVNTVVEDKAINDPTEIETTVKTHRRSARLNKYSSEIVEKDEECVDNNEDSITDDANDNGRKQTKNTTPSQDNLEKINAKDSILESAEKLNVTTRELRPRKLRQKRSIKKTKKKTKLNRMKIRVKSVKSKVSKLGKGLRKTVPAKIDVYKSCTVSNTAKPITEELKRITRKASILNLDPTADTSTDRLNKIILRSCSSNIEPILVTSATIETGFIGINRDSLRQSVRQSLDSNVEAEKKSSCSEPKTETTLTSISIGTGFTGIINKDSLRQSVRQSMDSNIGSEKNKSGSNQRTSSDIPIPDDTAGAQKDSIATSTVTNKSRKAIKNKIHVMLERKKKRRKRKHITKQTEEQISNNELNNNFILPLDFENEVEMKTEKISTKTRKQKNARKQIRANERRSKENILERKCKKSSFIEDQTETMEVLGKKASKKTKQPQRKLSPRFNMRKSSYMQNRLRQSVRLLGRTSLQQSERNLIKNINKKGKKLSITKTKPFTKTDKPLKKEDSNVLDVKKEWEVPSVSKKKQRKNENASKYHKTVCKNVNKTKNEDVISEYKNEIQKETPTRTVIKKDESEPIHGLKEIKIKSEQNMIVEIHNAITEQILKKKREKFNKETSIPETNKQAEKAKRGRPPKDGRRLKLKVELVELDNTRQVDVYDFEDDQETAVPPVKKHCKDPERTKETSNETYGKTKRTDRGLTENSSNVEQSGNNDQGSSQKKRRGRPPNVVSEGLIKLKTELVENNKFVQNNLYNYQDHLESMGTQLPIKKNIKKEPGLTNSRFNNSRSGLIDDRDGNTDSNDFGAAQQTNTSKTKSVTHVITSGIEQTESNQTTTQDKMSTRNNKTKPNEGNIKVNKGNLYKIIQNIKSEIKEKSLIKSETTVTAASKQDSNVNKDTGGTHGQVLDRQTYNQNTIEEVDVEQSSNQFNAELLNSMKIKREQLQYYASQASGSTNLSDIKVDKKNFLQKCPLCEKMYQSLFRMKQHLRKVHGGQLFDCDCCNETFIDKELYENHMKSHDDGIDCKFCGGKFTKDNIREHLVFHIQADQRGRISAGCFNKKQTSLLTHFLTKHNFKLQCHLCDDTFCPRSNMLRHYSTKHNDEKIYYTCEQCNKRFSLLQNLKRHLAIHEGITYECRLCDRKYSRLSDYKIHLNIHNGMKYQCPICFKCTSRPSYLKKHMIMLHQRQDYNVLTDSVGVEVENKE